MALRLGILAVAAIAVVGLTIALAAPGEKTDESGPASSAAPARALAGIPQMGIALGDPAAPITIEEFSDPQCPFCAEYHAQVFPTLLDRYVKTGKVRMEFNALRFLGPDSEKIALYAAGAAAENRMWDVIGLAYERQGMENSGYATDDFLHGLLVDSGLSQVDTGNAAERVLQRAETRARQAKIEATPSFLIGPTGGKLHHFQPSELTPEPFVAHLDAALEELSR
jgi:protein-disulfide isomerase